MGTIPRVLIDNGSAINVCPYRVLKKLGYTQENLKKSSSQVVRAYDNARRDVLGTIDLLIEYGPIARTVEFMVIDIEACLNFLLGRPWIHENQAVPSTLHQQVKILTKHGIVTIKGDPEIMSIHPATESVLQLDEELGTCLDGFNVCGYLNAGSDSEWVGVSNEEEPEIEPESYPEEENPEDDPAESWEMVMMTYLSPLRSIVITSGIDSEQMILSRVTKLCIEPDAHHCMR